MAFRRKGRTRSKTYVEATEFLKSEYNPSKHKLNIVSTYCSYMFRLLQSDHYHAVYQTCKKGKKCIGIVIAGDLCLQSYLWILYSVCIVCLCFQIVTESNVSRVDLITYNPTIASLDSHKLLYQFTNYTNTIDICYCRWNTQYIAHTRRLTVSAHHFYKYVWLTITSP
jgi:hypothetical protein